MSIFQRSFSSENDKHLMFALAYQFPSEHFHIIDLPYRFSSWALDDPENSRLWFDDEQLIAWAVLQAPWWSIDYACHPQYEKSLHPEILFWAEQRARIVKDTPNGRPAWFVAVFSDQLKRIHDLKNAGFTCQADVGEDSWSKVLMRRSERTEVKVYKPPVGFIVRPLAGEEEVKNDVALHQSVFESKTMTEEWRLRMFRHPAYRPDLHIVVQAPDGRLAAFCICWLSEDGLSGQVEPLGCHQDFRRYALGRVALSEGLQRLQALGAQNIFAETDSYRSTAFRLYESFDFQVIRDVHMYRKDI